MSNKQKQVSAQLIIFAPYFCIGFGQDETRGGFELCLSHPCHCTLCWESKCICVCMCHCVGLNCLHRCTDSLEKAVQKQTAWGMVHDGRATVAVHLLARNHILILKNPSNSQKEYTVTSLVQHSFALYLSPRNFAAPMNKLKADFFGNYHFLWRFAETVTVDQRHTESLLVW